MSFSSLCQAYEESLRRLSQVEAQVSVMLAENEKLRREAAIAAQMNAQELEHLRVETESAQRTIDEEKNAHSSTRIQVRISNFLLSGISDLPFAESFD